MNEKHIQAEMARASKIVKSWPDWKQNILIDSSKPTNSTPRVPVTDQSQPNDKKKD